MKIALIVIGNELLNGKVRDRNTHILANLLKSHGLEIQYSFITPDSYNEFLALLDFTIKSCDTIITCGGLGPTKDDLTKSMLAEYFNKKIQPDAGALSVVTKQYQRGNRDYQPKHMEYHLIPDGFEVLENTVGYAPGLFFKDGDKNIYALPGVPSEFSSMVQQHLIPKVSSLTKSYIKHVIVKTWKIPESKIFRDYLPDTWPKLAEFGEVSSLPHLMGVDISVKLVEKDLTEIERKEDEILNILQSSSIKDFIWSVGAKSLEEVIVAEALAKKLTIGFSESCTGGLCASRITDISGSSTVFWGSIVSYSNSVKQKSLRVKADTLKKFGAVSEQTALEMAVGAREELAVDIAISTTGIAGPGGGSDSKPVGTVGIGVSTKDFSQSKIYHFRGDREMLKRRFSEKALMTLLETIRKI